MTITGISSNMAPLIQSALDINKKLDDLQRQLASGQKADSYAGLGPQSGVTVALNAQLSALGAFDDTISNVGTTVSLQQLVLQQIGTLGSSAKSGAAFPSYSIDSTGQTTAQKTVENQLDQILSLLNTKGANGYLFSGSGLTQPSVDTADHILNGNGSADGLKQVITERNQADLGADGLGRLVIPPLSGTTVAVHEDVAGSVFGLKLTGVNSSLTGATVTGPTGALDTISVTLGASNPNDGDTISYTFKLPDGTSQTLTLQATTSTNPGANQFTIGATPALTAANLQAALSASVTQIGTTTLSAASAMAASNDFFDDPPQRVSGSPATATALVDGTPADTVFWYTGDDSSGSARSSQTARIDPATTVSYGTQANEQGIRWIVQNIATLAATTYSASDPDAANSYAALNQRVYTALAVPAGVQNITDIETSLANAQTAMASAKTQHQQNSATLTNMLQSIEGVDENQVGAEILSLQTSLSASLSTTARMAQLTLLNFLPPA